MTRKNGALFGLDEKTFAPVKDEEMQMCAGMALSVIYPGRLMAVRKPDGCVGSCLLIHSDSVLLVIVDQIVSAARSRGSP